MQPIFSRKNIFISLLVLVLASVCSFNGFSNINQSSNNKQLGNSKNKQKSISDGLGLTVQHKTNNKDEEKQCKTNKYNETVKIKASADSALYRDIVKINGWWVGRGEKITADHASHLNCYYKLSKKNNAGNWTYVEAFDGYHKPQTRHDLGTYIANQFDDNDKNINSEWRQKLLTVCKWQIIGDESGKEVIQERGLDADGNIVFCYNPTKVGERTYVGNYTDAWGLPIMIRTDSLGNATGYANYVQVTRDEKGREVLLKFTDRNGYQYKNKDGAYMTRKTYDENNNQIREESLNMVGERMIDDFGNCGWNAEYTNGNATLAIYRDADWKPMRMPNIARNDNTNAICKKMTYDQYGRITDQYILDALGQPDTISPGIHHTHLEYNPHGLATKQSNYDINENKVNDKDGIAEAIYYFNDKTGDPLGDEFRDKDGRLVNVVSLGRCKIECEYSAPGVLKHQIEYIQQNDSTVKDYEYFCDSNKNELRVWYLDNQCRIDSVDQQGRNILTKWTDLNGALITAPNKIWAVDRTTYTKDSGNIEEWFDSDGNYSVNDDYISKEIVLVDSIQWTQTSYRYLDDSLSSVWLNRYTENFNQFIGQNQHTAYSNEPTRVGWDDALYYTANINNTIYGQVNTLITHNEFGELAYFVAQSIDAPTVACYKDTNTNRYFDEFGQEIPTDSMQSFIEHLPKVYCLEITNPDIAQEQIGLRNNDIILSYGDWSVAENLRDGNNDFYKESILKASKQKNITILRHDIPTKTSSIITFNLPIGTWDQLGFYPHQICYTQKEKNRLTETCQKNNFTFSANTHAPGTENAIIMVPLKGAIWSTEAYWADMFNIKSPCFALEENIKETNNKPITNWYCGDSIDLFNQQLYADNKFQGNIILSYTNDLFGINHYSAAAAYLYFLGLKIIPVTVDAATYDALTIMQSDRNQGASESWLSYNLKMSDLQGEWACPKPNLSEYEPCAFGELYFDKKGNIRGYISAYVYHAYNVGTAWYYVTQILDGKYSLTDNKLSVTPSDKDLSIQILDFVCNNNDLRLAVIKHKTDQLKDAENQMERIRMLGLAEGFLNELEITDFSKSTIIFKNGITFDYKSKKANEESLKPLAPPQPEPQRDIIIVTVYTDGAFRDAGLDGSFYLLEMNNWDNTKDTDMLQAYIKAADTERRLKLVPYRVVNGNTTIGNVEEYTFAPGRLGVSIQGTKITESLYQQLMELYNNSKKQGSMTQE
jgi:hypothetical protein